MKAPLVNASVISERLGVPRWRTYDLAKRGILPSVRLGKRVMFDEERVEAFIESGGRAFVHAGGRMTRDLEPFGGAERYVTPLVAVRKSGQPLAVVMAFAVEIDGKPMISDSHIRALKSMSLATDPLVRPPEAAIDEKVTLPAPARSASGRLPLAPMARKATRVWSMVDRDVRFTPEAES